jgi:hypothetical protein
MRYLIVFFLCLFMAGTVSAQMDSVEHISRLEIKKNKRTTISRGDSSLTVIIDTLIMHDRAHLEFFGKKEVNLQIKNAIIPERAYISGTDGKNNASNITMTVRFRELGALYVYAAGRDAFNGTRTFPNGNGGTVVLNYLSDGLTPQQENNKEKQYLEISTKGGGLVGNANTEINNILNRIGRGGRPLGQLPQGQIYSGSPGKDGKSEIKEVNGF